MLQYQVLTLRRTGYVTGHCDGATLVTTGGVKTTYGAKRRPTSQNTNTDAFDGFDVCLPLYYKKGRRMMLTYVQMQHDTVFEIFAIKLRMTMTRSPLERAKVRCKYANRKPVVDFPFDGSYLQCLPLHLIPFTRYLQSKYARPCPLEWAKLKT